VFGVLAAVSLLFRPYFEGWKREREKEETNDASTRVSLTRFVSFRVSGVRSVGRSWVEVGQEGMEDRDGRVPWDCCLVSGERRSEERERERSTKLTFSSFLRRARFRMTVAWSSMFASAAFVATIRTWNFFTAISSFTFVLLIITIGFAVWCR